MWSRTSRRFMVVECLEPRHCLSGVSFVDHGVGESNGAFSFASLFAADLDGDNDMDVLSADWDTGIVAWFKNANGKGSFEDPKLIVQESEFGIMSVLAADLDSDNDQDVVSSSISDKTVSWFENTDGKGAFGQISIISAAANGVASLHAADLDGDNDTDVVYSSLLPITEPNEIVWRENTDGKGTFGAKRSIAMSGSSWTDRSLSTADLDADGDSDVLYVAHPVVDPETLQSSRGGLFWFENSDGMGSFGLERIIASNVDYETPAFTADFDRDGDLDVVAASTWDDSKIAWYENVEDKGDFWPKNVISESRWDVDSVFPIDIDGDHDVDVLSAFSVSTAHGGVSRFVWYENIDSRGTFGHEQMIADYPFSIMSALTANLDGDRDMDLLIASDEGIQWLENLTPRLSPGDANRDFQFNQDDIVHVLQSAKFLTGDEATFDQGDWNGDGVFDQLDIVAALHTGNYLQGARAETLTDSVFTALEP